MDAMKATNFEISVRIMQVAGSFLPSSVAYTIIVLLMPFYFLEQLKADQLLNMVNGFMVGFDFGAKLLLYFSSLLNKYVYVGISILFFMIHRCAEFLKTHDRGNPSSNQRKDESCYCS